MVDKFEVEKMANFKGENKELKDIKKKNLREAKKQFEE